MSGETFLDDLDAFSEMVGTRTFWDRPAAQIEGAFRGLVYSFARSGKSDAERTGMMAAFHDFNARRRLAALRTVE